MTSAVSDRVLTHVHAALHCNVNAVDVEASAAFWNGFGFKRRMHQVTHDLDGTPMGLPNPSAADTWFMYDGRGPRAAPALETVQWTSPATIPAEPKNSNHSLGTRGFRALGIRVSSLDEWPGLAGLPRTRIWVRGRWLDGVICDAPDGPVEIVEIASDDPAGAAYLSHVRLASTDLVATAEWYAVIGWEAKQPLDGAGSGEHLSLIVDEDPTFSMEFDHVPDAAPSDRTATSQGLFRVALAVEDVPGAIELMRSVGLTAPDAGFISMPDTPTGGFSVVFLADPDGAVVELVSRARSEVRRPSEPS